MGYNSSGTFYTFILERLSSANAFNADSYAINDDKNMGSYHLET